VWRWPQSTIPHQTAGVEGGRNSGDTQLRGSISKRDIFPANFRRDNLCRQRMQRSLTRGSGNAQSRYSEDEAGTQTRARDNREQYSQYHIGPDDHSADRRNKESFSAQVAVSQVRMIGHMSTRRISAFRLESRLSPSSSVQNIIGSSMGPSGEGLAIGGALTGGPKTGSRWPRFTVLCAG
jgi:hypothetical protein